MNSGFWGKLTSPFLVLAPMEGVTDTVFRRSIAKLGRPEVYYTEFTNVHGICSEGYEKVAERLKFYPDEKPIVAQIWGTDPEKFLAGARIVAEMGFDGIDINFGCPVKDVIKIGAGAAMISEDAGIRSQITEIIQAVKEGGDGLPVSVKTRIGNKKIITEDWIGFLLDQDLAAITVHLRTAADMSKVPARWGEAEKIVRLKNAVNQATKIIGNGDIQTRTEAGEMHKKYGVDGVMIGRGVFINPAVFSREDKLLSRQEKLRALVDHAKMYKAEWGDGKPFVEVRKAVKMYASGFDGAAELRQKLMTAENFPELLELLAGEI